MASPALPPAVALLAGVAVGWAHPAPFSLTVLCTIVGCGAAAICFARGATRCFAAIALATFTACGVALGSAARADLRTPLLGWYEASRADAGDAVARPVVVEGRLARDATQTGYGASLTIDVDHVGEGAHRVASAGGIRVGVGGRFASSRRTDWRSGRRIRMPVTLRRPARYANPGVPDQEDALRRRGISLLGSVKSALLVETLESTSRRRDWAAAARALVRREVSRSIGVHDTRSAGIVTAVLIGDRAGLDPETERRLQEGGTYHVIAISGGNIAILSAVLLLGCRVVGVGGRLAAAFTIGCLLGYGQIVGPEASVARAIIAATVFLAARVADHRIGPLNTLALTAGCLVAASPRLLTDPGFQLTFGATLGILVGVPRLLALVSPILEAAGRRGRWLLAASFGLLAATISAELALLPIATAWFSRVSFAGLALNFVAIPLMSVAQLAGMAAVGLGLVWPDAAVALGYVAHAAAAGIVESTRLVDVAPWLVWRVPRPPPVVTVAYYGGWLLWLGGRRLWARRLALGCVATAGLVVLIAPVAPPMVGRAASSCAGAAPRRTAADAWLRVLFLDVGQADATLVQLPNGRSMLVDAGGTIRGGYDVGTRVVAPALWAAGVRRLDYLVLTHGDPDHIGGAPAVMRDFAPREVWHGVPVPSHEPLDMLRLLARSAHLGWRARYAGDLIVDGGVAIRVVHPAPPDWERPRVRNDDSVVLELRYGNVSIVLPGDIGTEVEAGLADWPAADLRVLKVPHHGSRSSSSAPFLAALRPDLAIVSAGRDSRFGHPHPEVVRRYADAGSTMLSTGEVGAVTLCTDGRRLAVATERGGRLELGSKP